MRALLTLGLLASAAVPLAPNAAEDWQDFAMVSTTMGTQMNRLCAGADDSDIGCPSYAPSLTTAGDVSVTGNLSAVKFIGDGSELTGLTTTGDRITSGTSSIIVSESGHISFTTAGTERMVINASGNVGIGTTGPARKLTVFSDGTVGQSQLRLGYSDSYYWDIGRDNGVDGRLMFLENGTERVTFKNGGNVGIGTTGPTQKLMLAGNLGFTADTNKFIWPGGASVIADNSGGAMQVYTGAKNFSVSTYSGSSIVERLLIDKTTGNVGIGTTSPQATLQVSGSFIVSTSAQTTTPSLYVGTNGYVGVGTSAPTEALQVAGAIKVGSNASNVALVFPASKAIRTNTVGSSVYFDVGNLYVRDGDGSTVTGGNLRVMTGLSVGTAFSAIAAPSNGAIIAGNVGIGTTAPSHTLHVSGSARVTSWTAIAANVTPTTALDVYGTISATGISVTGIVSATYFEGDGSRLTGLTASGDRIVSDTTSIVANDGMDSISFTTAGNQRMTITSAGNVGIGTTSPGAKLSFGTNIAEAIRLYDSGMVGSSYGLGIASGDMRIYGASGADISFKVGGYSGTDLVKIKSSGNVGIGTTSPGKTLDVSGTAQIVSRTMIGGTATPSATLQVSGSLLLAGSDSTTCNDAYIGILRRNPTTGRLQVCK